MLTIILKFFSGIGVFLFSLLLLNDGLQKHEEKLRFGSHRYFQNGTFSCCTGMVFAALTQSSSAINSIIVNLGDKKIMSKASCYYAVMGTNIGTTITAYIAVLSNLNLSAYFTAVLLFSTLCMMLIKKPAIKTICYFLSVLSLLFVGLHMLSECIPQFIGVLNINIFLNSEPIALFFLAILITALCQSSSLISIFIISLSALNLLTFEAAMYMILGINIGTCSTPILASIGKSKTGFSIANFNLIFNILGALLFFFLYHTGLMNWFTNLNVALATKIALFHTFFNVGSTLVFFPFIPEIDGFSLKRILSRTNRQSS